MVREGACDLAPAAGRQDAALYGSQDGCRYAPAPHGKHIRGVHPIVESGLRLIFDPSNKTYNLVENTGMKTLGCTRGRAQAKELFSGPQRVGYTAFAEQEAFAGRL